MPYHVHNVNEVLGLNEDQARQDQDLIDHETAYNPHQKMNWIFPYIEGGPWIKDDTSRESIFTGVANQDTTESLAPIPIGTPFWPTEGVTLYNDAFQLLGAKVGNQYTMAKEGLIISARVDIPVGNVGLLVTASIHINDVQLVETTYIPRTSGIHTYTIPPSLVFIGDVVRVEVDTVKQTGNTQVHYLEAPAYWDTYSDPMFSNEQGLLDEVPNTNAYDIDIQFQEADVSDQWDMLAISAASLAPDEPLQANERLWVQTSTDNLEKFEVSTTDMAWTEIGRYPVADQSAVRGTSWVTATRTDGTLEGFYYEGRALIYRDGTITVQTQEICKLTPHPTVDFRSTVVGNDLVFEVRGSAIIAQNWDWRMIYFVRDIT